MMKRLFIVFTLLISCTIHFHAYTASIDLELIRDRFIAELLSPPVENEKVDRLLETMREDGTWPGINYEDVSRTGFEHAMHLDNMMTLSHAWAKPQSKYYKKKKIKKQIDLTLDYWLANDFICDNWWHNQIGTPRAMVNILLMLDENVTEEQKSKALAIIGRAHLNASGARPSGDRIKIAGILAKSLLYQRDEEQFAKVVTVINGEIKFATGRGMQYDYSFHHRVDKVTNTLSYGMGYAGTFADWAEKLSGTEYNLTDKSTQLLIDYYLDGICKSMVFGKYPDPGAKNRSISRSGTLKASSAKVPEMLMNVSGYRKDELKEITAIRNQGVKPTLSHATFYWHTECFTFQRPDYYTSVRMYSDRNHNMEVPYNGEGLKNHHLADGSNFISRTGTEYYNIFPVFDWQKIPGTTVVQKHSLPSENEIQKPGLTDFVGGLTDGHFGMTAFDFKSPHDPLKAKKAWFFFEDAYVCLGAGITGGDKLPVVTTLNQCLLRGDVIMMSGGEQENVGTGSHMDEKADWIWHDGVAYIPRGDVKMNFTNQTESGSWYDINHQSTTPKDKVEMEVFKLWIDHGVQPRDATYEYVVVPAASIGELSKYSDDKTVEILANTADLQAVRHHEHDIVQAIFHKAGDVALGADAVVTSDGPGLVMVKMKGGKVSKITVSDPTRKLGRMHLSVTGRLQGGSESCVVHYDEEKDISEVAIDLPQGVYAGQSVAVRF